MDCNKWEETGLLFSSGELSQTETAEYAEHLKACATCTEEYSTYSSMKKRLFSSDVLGSQPSAVCDAEILRVCTDMRKPVASFGSLSLVVKRSLISLSLFVFGFVGVSYVTIHMNDNSVNSPVQVAETLNSTSTDSVAATVSDSVSDSLMNNSVNFAKTRGNLGLRGVVPVDLQNK